MKDEALQLAKYLDRLNGYMDMPRDILDITQPSSAMIRRLVEELDYLKDQISFYELKDLGNQTKPLSDEEIGDCVDDYFGLMALQHKYIYDIDQVQEYGLKLAREILRKAQEK